MGEITIRKAFNEYKDFYMPYRNFAERTRIEYENDLQDFLEFMEKRGINNVNEVGIPIVERFVARLEQKGYASLTRKRKVVTIRSFLAFLYQEGYIETDIAKRVILPFTEQTTPQALTHAECSRIRKACADNTRDTAIIELLLQTGITLSELTRLAVDDIEIGKKTKGYVRIKGSRRNDERLIPLNPKSTEALSSYVSERNGEANWALFQNRFGEPLGERGIQKMLRKYLKAAGIEEASIQTLRHTFGAHHIARGTDPKTVQHVMGLKDTRSATVYQSMAREVVSRELQENSL